jgi:hypothetical protein
LKDSFKGGGGGKSVFDERERFIGELEERIKLLQSENQQLR